MNKVVLFLIVMALAAAGCQSSPTPAAPATAAPAAAVKPTAAPSPAVNLLAVIAQDSNLTLMINNQQVASVRDGPTTPEADAILEANGAIVLPNCLCNAGGMVVAHFEQAQNAINFYWSREQIAALLEGHMVRAFRAVHKYARSQGVSYQAAGCRLAVQRVADAVALRGWAR